MCRFSFLFISWVKVQIFQNPELFKILKLAVCLQISTISSLNGQIENKSKKLLESA